MSNPAPTLNQINAFNATQGTTIDFNIIGGTEVIRSNKIYIYDLSDNSLICTHLYVSTESIHELPSNTSSSIVYASGKSSADFTNNTQYYAQIQTFTDVGGTQGGSGLSIAKLFWCLPTPTLTLSTIPTTISTTSYNVSATYTPNTSGSATNEIQEFQFNLYSAIGALLQTSGVVLYGDGVDLSYNFSGLEIDSTYYVTLDITTTQGMNVSAQSNTFTVSIDTPTMGSASVVNNGCDGYISVTSNLSSEYKHEESVDSGDIMSFTTESLNDVVKLVVDIDPVQDLHGYDKPWVGGSHYNQWDEQWEVGRYDTSTGAPVTSSSQIRCKDFIPVTPNTDYYVKGSSTSSLWIQYYDSGKNIIDKAVTDNNWESSSGNSLRYKNKVMSLNSECHYIKFYLETSYGTTYNHDIAINYPSTVTTYSPWENICPITGWTGCEVYVRGVNIWDEEWEQGAINNSGVPFANTSAIRSKNYCTCKPNTQYYCASSKTGAADWVRFIEYDANKQYVKHSIVNRTAFTTDSRTAFFKINTQTTGSYVYGGTYNNDISINCPSTDHDYHAYNGTTYSITWQTEAGTVYGGTVDVVSGVLTAYLAETTYDGSNDEVWVGGGNGRIYIQLNAMERMTDYIGSIYCDKLPTIKDHNVLSSQKGISGYVKDSSYPNQNWLYVAIDGASTVADFRTWLGTNPIQVVYPLATPQTYQLDPVQVVLLLGQNNVWNNINGGMSIIYQLPITDLLVKRKDVADVSGTWLTLYSTPITQASDMDFTFIDFLNQYGKTYQYALVPVLAQDQSGVIVKIEGGYTVSDNVDSIFDGVYIADQTNVERVKAGVGYGNIDMNQGVGSITPIGSKYPIVITNSQNQYHNGSVRGTIVPNDFYSNGNLSRIDMVNKRDELEQFLTNKRAKIIKDWNGKMWLVMIMSNVNCSFDDNYGMGMVSFSADWLEVGDPTNQQDLYNAGLINVGGV